MLTGLERIGKWLPGLLQHSSEVIHATTLVTNVILERKGARTGLLATKATEYVGNPFLLIKFPAIALGLINVWVIKRSGPWRAHRERDLAPDEERALAIMAVANLDNDGLANLRCAVPGVALPP